MTEKFIYVFTEDAKAKLLAAGYELFDSDDRNMVYTFLNKDKPSDVLWEVSYLTGNTLTL